MEFKNLLIETVDNVATLTVNRSRSLNSLNSEVLGELECALYGLDLNADVRAVVLTGAGERAFVAGADIKEMSAMNAPEAHAFARKGQQVMLLVKRMKKPVIAAVNGYALGGGLELALACDFIYAATTARFGFPEVTLGIMPGFGGTQNLARLIGPNRANEMIFTGRMLDADQARAWGIVNEVFPPEELVAKARETARAIAQVSTLGAGSAKDAIANGLNMGREDGFRYEAALFGVLFATEDQREGMGAFVEKRRAVFTGK
ncbi:enoyl-CoA hydratase/isomerase family protein [Oryzomonas sagensis]|uniref:Enoyl-CoA hydratase/isomerase family protein n=1 Tax=Oryzomonas sagensis TaxID=2603857 RepID=A0ABQ6TSR9_9BACT|nr:enoyl-CoA hydratase-related protein [Oryzomonas sagensis]KAB0672093.1 enoyl-CoA hydratase/isomerase family protein [Oryzomonas sagensis]